MNEKIVHLNALDLDVSIPKTINFYDDGFVDDLGAHQYYVAWKYSYHFPSIDSFSSDSSTAGHILYTPDFRNFHIVYLKNSFCPIKTRGHEETHFLHAIKRLPVLSQRILQRQGVEIDFNEVKESIQNVKVRREVIAEMGAIFCYYPHVGWGSVEKFVDSKSPRSLYFSEAYNRYCIAINQSEKIGRKGSLLTKLIKNFS
jgi:hypothetical protein